MTQEYLQSSLWELHKQLCKELKEGMQAAMGHVVTEHHEAPLRCVPRHQDPEEEGTVSGVAAHLELEGNDDDDDIMGSKSVVLPPRHECLVCQKKFSKAWLVDEHVYQAHSDITLPYQCNYCQFSSSPTML